MSEKAEAKKDNFHLALASLEKALKEPVDRDVEIAGVIQMFEYTYETAWRLLKAVLEERGIETEYPKKVFVEAHTAGLIDDEKAWLRMIEDRNLTAHTYKKATATKILSHIRDEYLQLFLKVRKKVATLEP